MSEGLKLPVYILAGGKSSRFGSDKALAEFRGQPLLARLVDLVSPIASSITAIAKAKGQYADLGVRTIADTYQNAGPLAGIHAALSDAVQTSTDRRISEWVLVLSCDLVAFDCDWCNQLASHRDENTKAVAFHHEKWEPLLGLYRRDVLSEITRRLEAGHNSPQRLLSEIGACAVGIPKNWPSVIQVNTQEELLMIERRGLNFGIE